MEGVSHVLIDLNQESLEQYLAHRISFKELKQSNHKIMVADDILQIMARNMYLEFTCYNYTNTMEIVGFDLYGASVVRNEQIANCRNQFNDFLLHLTDEKISRELVERNISLSNVNDLINQYCQFFTSVENHKNLIYHSGI